MTVLKTFLITWIASIAVVFFVDILPDSMDWIVELVEFRWGEEWSRRVNLLFNILMPTLFAASLITIIVSIFFEGV